MNVDYGLYATLWAIWVHCNNIVFRNIKSNPYEIMRMGEELVVKERERLKGLRRSRMQSSSNEAATIDKRKFKYGSCEERVCEILVD